MNKDFQNKLKEIIYNHRFTDNEKHWGLIHLITDIRKHDEQQLLLKLSLETQYYGRDIEMKINKIIEEYYAK